MNKHCSRCGQPASGRMEPDPCCNAPDCEHLTAESHYSCLPRAFQIEADEWENYDNVESLWETYSDQ